MPDFAKFPISIAVITDNPSHAISILPGLSAIAPSELHVWDQLSVNDIVKHELLIFDVDVSNIENVNRLKKMRPLLKSDVDIVFPIDRKNHKQVAQSNALGAKFLIDRPMEQSAIVNMVTDICHNVRGLKAADEDVDTSPEAASAQSCLNIADMLDEFSLAVKNGSKLPAEDMGKNSRNVIETIKNVGMDHWLKAVRSHSSFTYRHVMIVTGIAASFGTTYSMNDRDKEVLTLGALVHDIGKVKIPQKILDKPGKLTDKELQTMRRHPVEGGQILAKDRQFDPVIMDIARHHHEFLDGSGYPDGLKAPEISDYVRVMTVVDIFSALIEQRSYKKSMPHDEAYETLVRMDGKLDQDIVRAFEPVAMSKSGQDLVRQVQNRVA